MIITKNDMILATGSSFAGGFPVARDCGTVKSLYEIPGLPRCQFLMTLLVPSLYLAKKSSVRLE